jgi:hypothetical protein
MVAFSRFYGDDLGGVATDVGQPEPRSRLSHKSRGRLDTLGAPIFARRQKAWGSEGRLEPVESGRLRRTVDHPADPLRTSVAERGFDVVEPRKNGAEAMS